jgi:hypothetical protein
MSFKELINNNSVKLDVVLYVQDGTNQDETLNQVAVTVAANGKLQATYGNSSNPYLQQFAFRSNPTDSGIYALADGSTYHSEMNTNNTITFNSLELSGLVFTHNAGLQNEVNSEDGD